MAFHGQLYRVFHCLLANLLHVGTYIDLHSLHDLEELRSGCLEEHRTIMSASPPLPTTKKSFFKKPRWATSAPATESGDFFRHSDTVYDSILREKEERREKHAQKKKAKAGGEDMEDRRDIKWRRISTDEEVQEEDGQNGSETASTGSREGAPTELGRRHNGLKSPAGHQPAPARRATCSNADPPSRVANPVSSNVIELGSDDDRSQPQPVVLERVVQNPVPDEEVSEEEDEYVLQLKQKAREKARLRKLGIDRVADKGQSSSVSKPQPQPPSSPQARSTFNQPQTVSCPPPKNDETIVQILITTKIPNAKALLVNRKVSQPMQQVREVWCSRQNFSEDVTAKIIFTWRGKRLYDTTTSTHLVNVLKKERARMMVGLDVDDEEDPSNGRIEVEAMTKDTYEEEMLRKSRRESEADANDIFNPEIQDRQLRESSTTAKEQAYQVVMNAQGLEALHLKVRPNTPVAKMMAAFKKMRQVDPEKTCWLVHDGNRLEPESIVGDTEIEDGDAVEVHVR